MSDVQIVIDTQSCVEHNVSPAEFEQKIKAAITELGFTVGIETRATHSNILGIHPLGCTELAFSQARNDIPKHKVYQIIMDVFDHMKQ